MNTYNGYQYMTSIDLFDHKRENVSLVDDGAAINIGCLITVTDTEVTAQDLKGTTYTTSNTFLGIDFLIRSYESTPRQQTKKIDRSQFTLQF